jgi:D-3-phosphoglycerate dehydrogenase
MKKILLLETLAQPAHEILEKAGDVEFITAYDFNFDKVPANEINAIITRGKGQVKQNVIDHFPNLSVVARAGVGLDNVDLPYASSKGIWVLNNPGANAQTVAEHTFGLILMAQRNLFRAVREVKQNNWAWRNDYEGDELYGKTLGIAGLGTIGKLVAEMAGAFGMKVIYSSRSAYQGHENSRTLPELMMEADIISLHLPLTADTKGIINEPLIEKMKPGAILVNTARGALVDEKALSKALTNNKLRGYAADVPDAGFEVGRDFLTEIPNVYLTPHVASLTARTYTKMCVDATNNVLAILRNETPIEGCIFNKNQLSQI